MKIKMLNLLFYFMYKEWSTRNCENKKEEKKKEKKTRKLSKQEKKKKENQRYCERSDVFLKKKSKSWLSIVKIVAKC